MHLAEQHRAFAPAGIAVGAAVSLAGLQWGLYPAIAGGLLLAAVALLVATSPR